MKNILITLIFLLAVGLLATQVLAWSHGYGHRTYGHRQFMNTGRTIASPVCTGWSTAGRQNGFHHDSAQPGYRAGHRLDDMGKRLERSGWNGPSSPNR